MEELFGGIIVGGIVGAVLKDKIISKSVNADTKQKELDFLSAENEKFSKRNKELERQVEYLLSELNKVRRKAKDADDGQDDLQDELDKANRELKKLRLQNDELALKVKEFKTACEVQEAEILMLKEKLS